MPVIFLDESGSFAPYNGQRVFIVSSFTVGDPRRTAKEFRKWQQAKFPKRKRVQAENKFSDSGIYDELRLRSIRFIASLDVRIHYGFFHCERIPEEYLRKQGRVAEGQLYTQNVGKVLESYFPTTDKVTNIFYDQRNLQGITQKDFKGLLKSRLLPIVPAGSVLNVSCIDSTTDTNIQIADWIVGAVATYLNDKPLGAEYHELLKGNIIGQPIELFKPPTVGT